MSATNTAPAYNRDSESSDLLKYFACPTCKTPLTVQSSSMRCSAGHEYPIVRGIPRFVSSDQYVDSFSFEWNTHNTTQLDFAQKNSNSKVILSQKTGLSEEDVRGKLVLDAGVGAGRFSDILSNWGANVIGADLSYAVEASGQNLKDRPNVQITQADIGNLPFAPETFDYIISIGVLHHTPDTRTYFERLVPLLKKGGTIAIWLYPNMGDYATRAQWIPYTYKIPDKMFYEWCRFWVPIFKRNINTSIVRWIGSVFPFSNQNYGLENDILDTFDGFSPRFHGVHNPEEVMEWFSAAGLTDIESLPQWYTSVRGKKPL
ncbi:MAG: methyltransferase domain-containing protein [Bdellovibrionota bacterium]